MSRILKRDLTRIGVRLALLQTTWCEGGMQSVGLAYCLLPGFRRISESKEQLKELVEICKEPFNTHPFLGGAVVGVALRLAEDGKSLSQIKSFLHGSMGPLAALGDPFLRGALPIFVAVASSLAAMYAGPVAGIVTLLLLFNAIHLFIRAGGFIIGFRDGARVLKTMGQWLSHTRTNVLKHVAAVGAGAVLAKAASDFGPTDPKWIPLALGISGVAASFGLVKWKPARVFFLPLALVACLLAEVLI